MTTPMQRGEVQGYDMDRMIVEFTMLDEGKVVRCAISSAAMDDIEGRRNVKADHRVDQFIRLRDVIEEQASRRFLEGNTQFDRRVVLRSNDFLPESIKRDGNVAPVQKKKQFNE
jgi:hypothetical protein